MTYDAAKLPKIKTLGLMQKKKKKEMIALTLLKAGFKFFDTYFAEQKS